MNDRIIRTLNIADIVTLLALTQAVVNEERPFDSFEKTEYATY